jgi:hypothetical protein
MASKYEPLEDYLQNQRLTSSRVSLSFKEIENIIGAALPKSAYTYREWWSNQRDYKNRPQAKAWLSAGFEVESVNQDLKSGSVEFVRKQFRL